ncbi:hypothetical protein HAALTHF_35030n [Vreelandella aquamarina]|nr:hypothetical protein HAALTHF_35030n [Halomonas axialensis]
MDQYLTEVAQQCWIQFPWDMGIAYVEPLADQMKSNMANPLPEDWSQWLGQDFQADYMSALKAFWPQRKRLRK